MTTFYIVTPSFNAAAYIDHAIHSVISQAGNFFIRYHVQDGGSTDGTTEKLSYWEKAIRKNALPHGCSHVRFTWKSEPDTGMYQAINRGFAFLDVPCDGIMAWVNTDDEYLPGAFATAARAFEDVPVMQWLGGVGLFTRVDSTLVIGSRSPYPPEVIKSGCCDHRCWSFLHQAQIFWKGSLWKKAGFLNENLKYAGDYELWTRFAAHADYTFLPSAPLCLYRNRPGQLSRQCAGRGEQTLYHDEVDASIPREERQSWIRQYWGRRLFPPKGPCLEYIEGRYTLTQKTAWPMWGQGWRFYYRRAQYYLGKLGMSAKKAVSNLLGKVRS